MSASLQFVRDRAQSVAEEVANCVTHGLGLVGSVVACVALVVGALGRGDPWAVAGAAVFGVTLVFMYLASTLYHACPAERRAAAKQRLRTMDHVAIYLLIAGTYTPFLLGPMRGPWGWSMFAAEWTLAALGIAAKLRYGFRRPGLSTAAYVGMGWMAAIAAQPLLVRVGPVGFSWLLAGGLCYTAGVAFYATDWRLRYGHAVWHLFVAGGSACHVWAALRHAGGVA